LDPLTHHEMLGLVAPFARLGRHVDLAASDRLHRRVAFKPCEHSESADGPRLRETLVLQDLGSGRYRLTRLLIPPVGPEGRLEGEGPDPGELLARIREVPPHSQFRAVESSLISLSLRFESGSALLMLTRAMAQVAGVTVTLDASIPRGPAAVTLTRPPGDEFELPQDALAVLGGAWSRLRTAGEGWAGELQLSRREPRRSRQAAAAIETAVAHLTHLLTEPPYRFHERWIVARWRVFLRRLVPLAACIGLIVCAAAVPKLHLAEGSGLRMLILNSPPILLILFFCLREVPIVEIPPLPRRSAAASWRARQAAPSASAAPGPG
jgi:hypothetical protein